MIFEILTVEPRPALFLDLDGTVRITKSGKPFAEDPTDQKLNGNILDIIKAYRVNGFLVYGITNQGGVAHGFKTLRDVHMELEYFHDLFEGDYPFDDLIYCPYDEKGTVHPYNRRSLSRKPNIGMLIYANISAENKGYTIDWDRSILVGDRPEDEGCARNAQIKFIHIDEFLKQKNHER